MADPAPPNDPDGSTDTHGASAGEGGRPMTDSELHPQERTPGRDGLGADLRPGNPSVFRPASYDPVSLRHIDWPAAFPFTNLFRGFRLAVHPSKLLLALAAVLLLYTGGRILDGVWMNRHQAFAGEAEAFDRFKTAESEAAGESFAEVRRAARESIARQYAQVREEAAQTTNARAADIGLGELETYVRNQRDRAISRANEDYK